MTGKKRNVNVWSVLMVKVMVIVMVSMVKVVNVVDGQCCSCDGQFDAGYSQRGQSGGQCG